MPVERAERPLVRARSRSSPTSRPTTGHRRPHLRDRARRPPHATPQRSPLVAPGGPAVHRAVSWAPTTSRRSSTPAAAADAGQEFTTNKRLLLAAVDRFMGRKMRSATLNRIDEDSPHPRHAHSRATAIDDLDRLRARLPGARSSLDSMRQRGPVPRRASAAAARRSCSSARASTTTSTDVFDKRDATTVIEATRDLLGAATRANVAIYAVDPRGLSGMARGDRDGSRSPTTRRSASAHELLPERAAARAGQPAGDGERDRRLRHRQHQRLRRRLPAHRRRQQLLLRARLLPDQRPARRPVPQDRGPGAGRPEARGPRAQGLRRARGRAPETEAAGPNDASPELRNAMASPLPLSELPMAATAAVFKGTSPNGSVVVSTLIGGGRLAARREGRRVPQHLEMAMVAVEPEGQVVFGRRGTRST